MKIVKELENNVLVFSENAQQVMYSCSYSIV